MEFKWYLSCPFAPFFLPSFLSPLQIELIARASHRNVVKLLGYCDDDMEQILIYEFVANGNLRQHLRPSSGELGYEL